MREIKFRAWDEIKNRFIPTDSFVIDSFSGDVTETNGYEIVSFNHEAIPEQYTGLDDKNGQEIYENDIVKIHDTSYGDVKDHYGVVTYSEYAELVVDDVLLSKVFNDVEVVGNIHENSELLDEQ